MPIEPSVVPPSTFNVTTVKESFSLEPEFFWSGAPFSDDDHALAIPHWPSLVDIRARVGIKDSDLQNIPTGLVIKPFWNAIIQTTEPIWIFDQHFDSEAVKWFSLALQESRAKEVNIFSSRKHLSDDDFEDCKQQMELARKNRYYPNDPENKEPPLIVSWLRILGATDFDFAHDRFAVVENELWHFGSNIGGTHRSLTAQSRGWSAIDCNVLDELKVLKELAIRSSYA